MHYEQKEKEIFQAAEIKTAKGNDIEKAGP